MELMEAHFHFRRCRKDIYLRIRFMFEPKVNIEYRDIKKEITLCNVTFYDNLYFLIIIIIQRSKYFRTICYHIDFKRWPYFAICE